MSKVLTQLAVQNEKPAATRREIADRGARGLYLIVQPSGSKSWCVRYRLNGRTAKLTLGSLLIMGKDHKEPNAAPAIGDALTLAGARKLTAEALHNVQLGGDPSVAKRSAQEAAASSAANTLKTVCEEFLKREGKNLRSLEWRRAILERLVYPKLGARPIGGIKRSEIIALLDDIETDSGPVMADRTLAVVRKIMNWHAIRDDEFRSPVVRGMARTKPKERARARVLNDDELSLVWKVAGATEGPFGKLVQFLLLSAARRNEAADLTRGELSGSDWTLPAARNKTKLDLIRPLPDQAMALLDRMPRIDKAQYFFTTDGSRPLRGFSKFKKAFDVAVLKKMREHSSDAKALPQWTLHDLRRTARSLMSRAGVSPDHAERCLGHVIAGVRGTYDRHEYHPEKKAALEALAAQIDAIVHPQPAKVLRPKFPRRKTVS